jgi:hypothetical protein
MQIMQNSNELLAELNAMRAERDAERDRADNLERLVARMADAANRDFIAARLKEVQDGH